MAATALALAVLALILALAALGRGGLLDLAGGFGAWTGPRERPGAPG